MKFLTIALAMLLATASVAGTIIIDGATIDVDGMRIRIVQIDTPETFRSRSERELVLGLAAKERLRAVLDSGEVTFKTTGVDRYGRTLAHMFAGGVDVGERLLRDGHAAALCARAGS